MSQSLTWLSRAGLDRSTTSRFSNLTSRCATPWRWQCCNAPAICRRKCAASGSEQPSFRLQSMKLSMSPPSQSSVTKYTKRWSSKTSKSRKVLGWSISSIMRTSRLKSSMSPMWVFRICFTALGLSQPRFSCADLMRPKVPWPIWEPMLYLSSICAVSFAERWSQTICGKQEAPKEPGPTEACVESAEHDHCERLRTSEPLVACASCWVRTGACCTRGKLCNGPGVVGSKRTWGARTVRPTVLSRTVTLPGSPRSSRASKSCKERLGPSSHRGPALPLQTTNLYSNLDRRPVHFSSSLVQIG
mmetsp:Transcript_56362/g.113092  ORF Transcript_56362/g.113092 Transcript_56362/m.113092 type:complete len:302 (-) Transcript_56362:312-1217(-)